MSMESDWKECGNILFSNSYEINRYKIILNKKPYEFQSCYLEPVLSTFAIRVDNKFNPNFDYLERLLNLDKSMNNGFLTTREEKLSMEIEKGRGEIKKLKEENYRLIIALNDEKLKTMVEKK